MMHALNHFVSLPERVFFHQICATFSSTELELFFNVTSCCVTSKAANIECVISTPLNFF